MRVNPQTATIRDARAEDLPRLLVLYQQLSELGQRPEAAVRPVTEEHRAMLARISADPNTRLFVVEEGGEVVGSFALYVILNLSHGARPFAIVENVVVADGQRGSGLGRRLMEEAIRLAREAGCYKIGLTSNHKRPGAHAFYEMLGFENTHHGFTLYFEDEDG